MSLRADKELETTKAENRKKLAYLADIRKPTISQKKTKKRQAVANLSSDSSSDDYSEPENGQSLSESDQPVLDPFVSNKIVLLSTSPHLTHKEQEQRKRESLYTQYPFPDPNKHPFPVLFDSQLPIDWVKIYYKGHATLNAEILKKSFGEDFYYVPQRFRGIHKIVSYKNGKLDREFDSLHRFLNYISKREEELYENNKMIWTPQNGQNNAEIPTTEMGRMFCIGFNLATLRIDWEDPNVESITLLQLDYYRCTEAIPSTWESWERIDGDIHRVTNHGFRRPRSDIKYWCEQLLIVETEQLSFCFNKLHKAENENESNKKRIRILEDQNKDLGSKNTEGLIVTLSNLSKEEIFRALDSANLGQQQLDRLQEAFGTDFRNFKCAKETQIVSNCPFPYFRVLFKPWFAANYEVAPFKDKMGHQHEGEIVTITELVTHFSSWLKLKDNCPFFFTIPDSEKKEMEKAKVHNFFKLLDEGKRVYGSENYIKILGTLGIKGTIHRSNPGLVNHIKRKEPLEIDYKEIFEQLEGVDQYTPYKLNERKRFIEQTQH